MRITIEKLNDYLEYGVCGKQEEKRAVIYGIMLTESSGKIFVTEKSFFDNIIKHANNYLKQKGLYTNYISKK